MAPGYDISQIGYSPLGTMGLGSSGSFANYDNYMPSFYGLGMANGLGMNQSIWNAGAMGMNPMMMNSMMMNPMMGYLNPAYMAQLQQQVETSQAQHAGNMHTTVLNNEVNAYNKTDSALISKILANSSVQHGLQNLYTKVQQGDADGICCEMEKLKQYIYDTYSEEFKANGSKNPAVDATKIITDLYANIAMANNGGQRTSLYDDIVENCEDALTNGFFQGLKKGHHKRYKDQVLNECLGLKIDNKEQQDSYQAAAKVVGTGASVLKHGAYGAALGAGVYTLGGGAVSLAGKSFGCLKNMKFSPKTLGKFAAVSALATVIADCIWKFSDTSVA